MDEDPGSLRARSVRDEKIDPGALDLIVKAHRTAAYRLQFSWKAHLVRAILWRRRKVISSVTESETCATDTAYTRSQ
jgi:hypothetical protein